MSAIIDTLEETFTTQTAPSGPIEHDFVRRPAENFPEVFVVYKTVVNHELGFSSTRFIGAYFNRDTARTVASTFGAFVVRLEIGLFPTITKEDLH
jgi:hypothetical protein